MKTFSYNRSKVFDVSLFGVLSHNHHTNIQNRKPNEIHHQKFIKKIVQKFPADFIFIPGHWTARKQGILIGNFVSNAWGQKKHLATDFEFPGTEKYDKPEILYRSFLPRRIMKMLNGQRNFSTRFFGWKFRGILGNFFGFWKLAFRTELGWPRLFNPPTGKKSQPTKWFIDFPLQSSPRAIEPHKVLQNPTANPLSKS